MWMDDYCSSASMCSRDWSRSSSPESQSQNMDIAEYCSLNPPLPLFHSLQSLMLPPLVARSRMPLRELVVPAGRVAAGQCQPAGAPTARAVAAMLLAHCCCHR